MYEPVPSGPLRRLRSVDRRPLEAYSAAFCKALAAAEALAERLPEERSRAGLEAGELLALPAGERGGLLDRNQTRFRWPVLAEHLIAATRDRIPAAPADAVELASLALRVLGRAETGVYGTGLLHELRVRARAHRADARRAAGDLVAAEACFRRLIVELNRQPLLDPHVRGEVFGLLARLRRDQQRPSFALRLRRRAGALLRRPGGAAMPEVRLPRLWPRPAGSVAGPPRLSW